MIKAVIDTNIFVSGTINSSGIPSQILALWRSDYFSLISSPALTKEIRRVFNYPHIKDKYYLTNSYIEILILEIEHTCLMTSGKLKLKVIKDDPSDDKFLIAGIEGKADYIVSGDKHLKSLKTYQGIKIISPADFLNILTQTF